MSKTKELIDMLKKHQWSATAYGGYGSINGKCPECGGTNPDAALNHGEGRYEYGTGHKKYCQLYHLITGIAYTIGHENDYDQALKEYRSLSKTKGSIVFKTVDDALTFIDEICYDNKNELAIYSVLIDWDTVAQMVENG